MSDDPLRPEVGAVRRAFDRAAQSYDDAAVLQAEVGDRLIERLALVREPPRRILDVGAGTGRTTTALMRAYRKARVTALDIAPGMLARARGRGPWWRGLRCIAGDAVRLPVADDSFDAIFSNLTLQWVSDLDAVFREFQRVLRPGGVLMFSSFGPDTLTELRQAWAAADDASHVHRFIDMHDVGDAMARAKLADPVMDMEYFTLTYDTPRSLMRDLKAIGAQNATAGRARGLTGRERVRAMERAYEAHRDAEGRLPATWEVIYGHAWGTDAVPQHTDDDGATRVEVGRIPVRRRGEAPS
jgi:malonyl-CoA O-methyltransferase